MKKLILACALSALLALPAAAVEPAELFAGNLVDAKGKEIAADTLKGKIVGIYYSAEWCPPCRAFTPDLVKFQKRYKDKFALVFVSSDKSAEEQAGYMKKYKMDWAAVPWKSEVGQKLKREHGISGIPSLVILSPTGEVITKDGRSDVASEPTKALKKWQPSAGS